MFKDYHEKLHKGGMVELISQGNYVIFVGRYDKNNDNLEEGWIDSPIKILHMETWCETFLENKFDYWKLTIATVRLSKTMTNDNSNLN